MTGRITAGRLRLRRKEQIAPRFGGWETVTPRIVVHRQNGWSGSYGGCWGQQVTTGQIYHPG